VTGGAFLAVMENTVLCYVPVGTVFKLDGASHHFSRRVRAFLDREIPDCWIGRGGAFPGPLFLQIDSAFFILGVCKRHCLS